MTALTDRSTLAPAMGEDVLARVRELHPLLRKNAAQGELDRRVVNACIDALRDAGALRVAQPKRYGGHEGSVRMMLDVSSTVAEADGGTAWVVALLNVCAWLTALFPEAAQDDVWADAPDALVSGVLAPSAQSRKVDGGHVVTGRWYWNSGSWHADWAVLGLPITDASGEAVDQGLALIPRTDLDLEDTWFVAGMKSTASNCLVATDAFVPDHRIISVPAAIGGKYGTERKDEVAYQAAFVPVLALVLAGPQLGLGRAALEFVKSKAATKPIAYTFYTAQADSVAFQLQLAKAAMLIDTAHLHAYRAAEDIETAAHRGEYLDYLRRARVRADTGWAVEHIVDAINVLLSAHGAGSFAESNDLQRIWRDSEVAARHAVALPMVGYEVFGKALLERDDQITPLV